MTRLRDSQALLISRYCGSLLTVTLICAAMATADEQTRKLSSGHEMPVIGLGTWQLKPEDVDTAVAAALDAGYRHIDTAFLYANEAAIGRSLKKWFDKGNKRENLFVTTKLPLTANRASDVEALLKLSLQMLNLQYVDLYLIHLPIGVMKSPNSFAPARNKYGSLALDYDTDHVALWKAMEAQVKAGRVRSIGLSNFNQSQIQNVYDNAEIKPSNLQIEWQLYNQQRELLDFCRKLNISVTGYSTLGSLGFFTNHNLKPANIRSLPRHLENPIVREIAERHGKTPAQVLLRHALQNDVIVIPKSSKPSRIRENHDVFGFELSTDEMKELNGLDKGEDGRLHDFLSFHGLEKHPHYPFTAQLKNSKAQ